MTETLIHVDPEHELEDHDRGLVFDLSTLDRRQVLKGLGFAGLNAGLFTIIGCGPSGATASGVAVPVGATPVGTDARPTARSPMPRVST